MSTWQPIQDLPADWHHIAHDDLQALARYWKEQKKELENTNAYQRFLERMRRQIAIETGIIERLYTIDRGTTRLLIEHGIDEALIPHGATNDNPAKIVRLIRDQNQAIESIFDFVGSQRDLSTSYIKSLHQLLTRNQTTSEAVDQFGRHFEVELLRGQWKDAPNNPVRDDGSSHEYCPPLHVPAQMDELIRLHREHMAQGVNPEVEAAWLHHRFTQIHPFQDGNGRVARMLASLVLIRAGWFPLVITRDDTTYIDCLEQADAGNLAPLIDLFAKSQRKTFYRSLSLSEDVLAETQSLQSVLDAAVAKLQTDKTTQLAEQQQLLHERAKQLQQHVDNRLATVRQQVDDALSGVVNQRQVYTTSAYQGEDTAHWYFAQILEMVNGDNFDYYANFRVHQSWSRLVIRLGDMQTVILLSFHGIGYGEGPIVCAPCAFQRVTNQTDDADDTPTNSQLNVLADAPFHINAYQDMETLQRAFEKWLENVLVVGLAYWRARL